VTFVCLLKKWYSGLHCSVKWNDMLGEPFSVVCGVRQDGILSPYLSAVYVDKLIEQLRRSRHGIHIGQSFVGCAVYADNIVLMSASCHGLQKLVDICSQYSTLWDIKFNTLKSQLLTFGASNPEQCRITMNNAAIPWVMKVKYLGVTLLGNSCSTDLSAVFRKFYGQFNNILSVLGGNANKMSTLHIVKTYCIPTFMYGCEAWSLSVANLHKLDDAWNNCFRRIFQCCWRETTRPL